MPDEYAEPPPRADELMSLSPQKKMERRVLPLANRFDLPRVNGDVEPTNTDAAV